MGVSADVEEARRDGTNTVRSGRKRFLRAGSVDCGRRPREEMRKLSRGQMVSGRVEGGGQSGFRNGKGAVGGGVRCIRIFFLLQ